MLKRWISLLIVAVTISILAPVSTAVRAKSPDGKVDATESSSVQSEVPASGLARLRHGINLSHWFAQSADYSKTHLESHTRAEDIALNRSIGFDHVRLTIEPAPLFNGEDPSRLKAEYLKYLDNALDLILAQGLAVIIDIHPSDEFKVRLNSNDRQIEAFGKFWRALAQHLSTRDPEWVFLEVINEPMVEDGYRWFGMQGKLISAARSGAPQHTIIASGHRWSGLAELLFMLPYADRNIIYNFHFYEPFAFTHQGATWAGPNLPFYKNIPYPSNPESVSKVLDTIQMNPRVTICFAMAKTVGTPPASTGRLGWLPPGPQSIRSLLPVTNSGPFATLRRLPIAPFGLAICAPRWKSTASAGQCGITRAALVWSISRMATRRLTQRLLRLWDWLLRSS